MSFAEDVEEIRQGLLLGSQRFETLPLGRLRARGVTHVVQVGTGTYSMAPTHQPALTYCLICAYDQDNVELLDLVRQTEALQFIHNAQLAGGTVLVHCQVGMSRSATVVIAYLMQTERLPFSDALVEVLKRRAIVQPNPGFCEQLRHFEALGSSIERYTPAAAQERTFAQENARDQEWLRMIDAARNQAIGPCSQLASSRAVQQMVERNQACHTPGLMQRMGMLCMK